jgi:hypothetical protein
VQANRSRDVGVRETHSTHITPCVHDVKNR